MKITFAYHRKVRKASRGIILQKPLEERVTEENDSHQKKPFHKNQVGKGQ